MDEFTREIRLDGGSVDMDTGRFPMVLASEGEASDGHIVGIDGMEPKASIPMLFAHSSTIEVPSLGKIVEPVKSIVDGVRALRSTGIFNLDGDDPLAGVRRGIARLVNNGDLPAVSLRWKGNGHPRRNLPKDHAYYVGSDIRDERSLGLFFEAPEPLEGSIVAIGADPKALAGRALESSDDIESIFFHALANSSEVSRGMLDVSSAFKATEAAIKELNAVGCEWPDIARMFGSEDPDTQLVQVGTDWIPFRAYSELTQRVGDDMSRALRIMEATESVAVSRSRPQTVVPLGSGRVERLQDKDSVSAIESREFASRLGSIIAKKCNDAVYARTGRRI